MPHKAIFFDRDLTLTYFNPEKDAWRDRMISGWLGRPFALSPEALAGLSSRVRVGPRWCKTVEDEKIYYREYYRQMLIASGVSEQLEARAEILFQELWCNFDRLLYPETESVLQYFNSRGWKLGVISDTRPSLEMTLEQLGVARYFDCFVCCSIVGAHKPEPIVYETALRELNVTAAESVYVDDHPPAAEGARALGFTSFLLDRAAKEPSDFTVTCLRDLIDLAEGASI